VPTLHVRNVPDVLYEALRLRAERDGRSIASEAIELLQQALVQHMPFRGSYRMRPGPRAPFERFTTRARRALPAALEAARSLQSPVIEPEHVLLGLLEERRVRRTFESLQVDPEEVAERVRAAAPEGEGTVGEPDFSPRTKLVLELALREALAAGHDSIGLEHVLVAVAREEESPAAAILAELGADASAIRGAVLLPALRGATVAPHPEAYRAVTLRGTAEEWTDELNRLGSEGWELFAVTAEAGEPRAVFRRLA
jgi:hypothetical protein